jgi:hypothetical protein
VTGVVDRRRLQRPEKLSPIVAGRVFSAAMAYSAASAREVSIGITAAGAPANRRVGAKGGAIRSASDLESRPLTAIHQAKTEPG